jgi:hypothetical protein
MTQPLATVEQTIAKIKSHGFWEIVIRPVKFDRERIESLAACKELIEGSVVRFRGWDYPHISINGIKSGTDWVESHQDWSSHLEYWRMYKTAQFFHIFGCMEDWEKFRIYWSKQPCTTPGYGLEPFCALFTLTEIYEFVARLAKRKAFDDTVKVSISLNGMKSRRLVSSEIHTTLNDNCICIIDKIPIDRITSIDEIIGRGKEFAVNDTIAILERFNWFNAPKGAFEEEQDKLINGRL